LGSGRQQIPRPPQWSLGPEAPWVGRDLAFLEDRDEVHRRLARRIDDASRVESMPDDGVMRPSAVLVPIVDVAGAPGLVLTRRSQHLTHHKGEVSFPGGRLDPGETPVSGALREAHEEIALVPSSVSVIGTLPSVVTYASNSAITPVVGVVEGAPSLDANVLEEERVFTDTFRDLVAPGVFTQERWPIAGRSSAIHFYDLPDDILWGVTGRMVTHLLDVLTRP